MNLQEVIWKACHQMALRGGFIMAPVHPCTVDGSVVQTLFSMFIAVNMQ